jgi:signal transduction histidine kinase
MFLWTTFYIFERIAPSVQIRWMICTVEYLAICYIGFFAFMFSRSYRGLKKLKRYQLILLLTPPTFFYLSVLTNPLHHQFYKSLTRTTEVYGPLCWLLILETFIYYLGGVYHFIRKSDQRSIYRKKQMIYFSFAIITPIVIHILYTIKVIDVTYNASLVVMPFSNVLITISVLKYKFLDILPHALLEVVESLEDGFLVINAEGDLEDYNAVFFDRLIDISQCKHIDEVIDALGQVTVNRAALDNVRYSINVNKDNYISGEVTFRLENEELCTVQYTTKAINDVYGAKIATIITLHDITELQSLYEALESKKNELMFAKERLEEHMTSIQLLTIENERNKLMSEVHDTLGHSMTEILALLEKCDLMLNRKENSDVVSAEAAIEEAIARSRDGLSEIRKSVTRFKKMGVEI